MFANEKLLQQTPRFTLLLMAVCVMVHTAIYFGYLQMHKLALEPHLIRHYPASEAYRLFTAPFLSGPNWKAVLLSLVG